MIITRSWLEEFIDIDDISNQKLYELFNKIGLEVGSIKEIEIPSAVVVAEVLSCKKHPDADKLNICQVDTGEGIRQIVCGASNVKNTQYVAVATVGAKLSDDFLIKPAQIRGIQSDGMICSSSELGLPDTGDGIMELDNSIGVLDVGRELSEYPKFSDTIIELELTANRGDCLSIHGVARDLGVVLSKDTKMLPNSTLPPSTVAIAKELTVVNNSDTKIDLLYKLTEPTEVQHRLLTKLRLGYVGLDSKDALEDLISYSTHATGVIIRAYNMAKLQGKDDKVSLALNKGKDGLIHLLRDGNSISTIGVCQKDIDKASVKNKEILFEASYIAPESIIEGVSLSKVKTDLLYYKTSRGSEPDLDLGFQYLELQINQVMNSSLTQSYVSIESEHTDDAIPVFFEELDKIIGTKLGKSETQNILTRLGFKITNINSAVSFTAIAPNHRHDIANAQDIAEELLRMIGIDKIEAKPLKLIESVRLTEATAMYKIKKSMRQSAASNGFYETLTYTFSHKEKLEKYGFETLKKSLDLINPIAEDLNTLRSTILINLLDSVKRNVSYGIKRVPLFEIGSIFDKHRDQRDVMSFVWSGFLLNDKVSNQGKPTEVDFTSFVEKIEATIGAFELSAIGPSNNLMHPFQSASVIQNNQTIGYISKLHPSVMQEYGIPVTFVAEFDLLSLVPPHINATAISNFQGTYKDISIVIDDAITYDSVSKSISSVSADILKRYFPVDIYSDKQLGEKKSMTIRLYMQSTKKTLEDVDIESVVQDILEQLTNDFGATLR